MKKFEAEATINATPEKIWGILTDTDKWPEWDPFCEKIEGKVALGQKVKAFSKLSPGRGFSVKVTELVPNERMTWSGGMPFGLFKGVRTYVLSPNVEGAVDFTMREVFSGPMLALIGGSLPDLSEAFEKFAEGLKNRAETAD